MRAAERTDWKTEFLPVKRSSIHLDRGYSTEEVKRIQCGLVPQQMEDKWFIYWEDDMLHFHRSWTGFCIYVVGFASDADGFKMVNADVNRDPEQYEETSDKRDADMIYYLVDLLLLDKDAEFPPR